MKRVPLLLVALAAAACGTTNYAFVPAAGATAALYGHPAADYPIPAQAPQGDLRVASYGLEPLTPSNAPDEQLAALHIRVLVSNAAGQAGWTFDTREQEIVLAGRGTSTPAFASASPGDGSAPPVLTIPPRSTRIVDLFFPLPPEMQAAEAIPAFQTTARVHTDAGLVAETTPFARVEADEAYEYAAEPYPDYAYWDSPFWYNTTYVGFYGVARLPPVYWGRPVFVRPYGWGRPGYYRGGYGYRGGFHGGGGGFHGGGGGFHGGGGHGGHR
jgi:hypothetical protein